MSYISVSEKVHYTLLKYSELFRGIQRFDISKFTDNHEEAILAALAANDLDAAIAVVVTPLSYMRRDALRTLARTYNINPKGKDKPQIIEEILNARHRTRAKGRVDQTTTVDSSGEDQRGLLLSAERHVKSGTRILGGSAEVDPTHFGDDLRRLEDDPEAAI